MAFIFTKNLAHCAGGRQKAGRVVIVDDIRGNKPYFLFMAFASSLNPTPSHGPLPSIGSLLSLD